MIVIAVSLWWARRAPSRIGALLIVGAIIVAGDELSAQSRRDTLIPVSSLAVPDSMALTYVRQLVPAADGSVFLIDVLSTGVLAFGRDGAFRRRIGRRGDGPGELLSPWRLGLLGPDTLWVVDARQPRVNLYDAATGESLLDLGPSRWDAATTGGGPLRPFAVLADHGVVAIRRAEEGGAANVLAIRAMDRRANRRGVSLAVLDLRDRLLAVPVPAGGRGLQLRNPFSYGDMLAIAPSGTHFAVIRRPEPAGSPAFFTVEWYGVHDGGWDSIQVPYTPRPLEPEDLRAWAEDLEPVDRMVEMGVFPGPAAGISAVLDALDAPGYYPPVANRGPGIVEEGVLVDSGAAVWLQVSDAIDANEWIVVAADGGMSRLTAPNRARLLAARGDMVWAEVRDGVGVPTVHLFRVRAADR